MARVLIIEGDRARAYRLATMCRRLGLAPHLSPDPLHGLMRALRDKPDIILVDAKDNWAGALPFAESLRQDGALSSIPVIVVGEELDNRTAPWGTLYGGNGDGEPPLEQRLRAALRAAADAIGPAAARLADSPAVLPDIVGDTFDKALDQRHQAG